TAQGKASSSRNALRHGLATISRDNLKLFPDIERMANALCNGDDNPLLFEQALVIAENELVLRCVSAERVATIERMRDITARPLTSRDNSIGRAKARLRAAKSKYAQLVRAKTNNTNAAMVAHQQSSKSSPQSRATQTAKEPRKFRDDFDAVCQ